MKLEAAAMAFLCRKQCYIIGTEFEKQWTNGISDVFGIDRRNEYMYEIEVKRSIGDFRNDFKKRKHKFWSTIGLDKAPNYFYFIVPLKLREQVLEEMRKYEKEFPIVKKYGLLSIKENWSYYNGASSAKKVRRLHDKPASEAVKNNLIGRISRELMKHYGVYDG